MVDLSKFLFNNKLLSDVISFRVTPFLWRNFVSLSLSIYIYIHTLNSLTKNKYNQTLRG